MNSGSVSKTATTMGRTQPAISLAIKNLEQSLGLKLFERQGRQLVPVPEAFYLQDEAKDILQKLSTVRRTMSSLQNAQFGSLNLSAMPSPASYLFPRFISRAISNNDSIKISLSAHSSNQIHELAATQSIDFGFADVSTTSREFAQYRQEVISANSFCALPSKHPLAKQNEIAIKDLNQVPMGSLQINHLFTQKVISAFQKHRMHFNNIVDSQTNQPLLQFVSAGQCLAIIDPVTMVTELQTNSTHDSVVFRPMAEPLCYEYAVLSSRIRPLSQLAKKIKQDWINEVITLLEAANASPRIITTD